MSVVADWNGAITSTAEGPALDTASAVLTYARAEQKAALAADANVLKAAVMWADQHPVDSIIDAATWPGGQGELALAGEGAPLVAEFCVAELAVAIGVCTDAGRDLIADALEIRHRLPQPIRAPSSSMPSSLPQAGDRPQRPTDPRGLRGSRPDRRARSARGSRMRLPVVHESGQAVRHRPRRPLATRLHDHRQPRRALSTAPAIEDPLHLDLHRPRPRLVSVVEPARLPVPIRRHRHHRRLPHPTTGPVAPRPVPRPSSPGRGRRHARGVVSAGGGLTRC